MAQAILLAMLIIPYFAACDKDKDKDPPKSNLTEMSNFNITAGGQTFSAVLKGDGKTFEFMPPFMVGGAMFDLNHLKTAIATFNLSQGATSVPASGDSRDFYTSDVNYKVTAEDGTTTKDYVVTWVAGTSSEAKITAFSIENEGKLVTCNINGTTRVITIPLIANVPMDEELTPVFTISLGATCSPASGVAQDYSSPVEYTVSAHDGTQEKWSVVRETSTEAKILSFNLTLNNAASEVITGVINNETSKVTFSVPYDKKDDIVDALPEFTLSPGAVADPVSGVEQDFSEAVEYTVTAHDGKTAVKWTVEVEVEAPSTQAEIVHFYLDIFRNPQSTYTFRGEIKLQDNNSGYDDGERIHGGVYINSEEGIITWDMPAVPEWFTMAHLTNIYPPVIQISEKATVEPAWNAPQDFSKDVVYTVTAQSGDKKVWTVKAPATPYYLKAKWTKEYSVYDESNQNPNSIAVIGSYVALGRVPFLINKSDGTKANVDLNITDVWKGNVNFTYDEEEDDDVQVQPAAGAGQNYPFFITNDDEGNMIGASLGAWRNDMFTLYKWSDATIAPEILMEFPTKAGETPQFGSFGRKLQVLGDADGKALIISPNSAGTDVGLRGEHYLWKVNGGVVDVADPTVVETNIPWGSNTYQVLTPLGTDPVGPYYVGSYARDGQTGVNQFHNLQFGEIGAMEFIPGPFGIWHMYGTDNRWGNFSWFYQKAFSYDGKNFVATFSSGWGYQLFSVLERKADNSHVAVIVAPFGYNYDENPNGNRTGSFTMERVGDDIFFYIFQTNAGVYCYQMTKF